MVANSLESWEYLASYTDLMAAFGTDTLKAATHYNTIGIIEHRTITFDPTVYLAKYADLQTAFGTNALLAVQHYVKFGYAEGRSVLPGTANYITPNSLESWEYLASYDDLMAAFGTDTLKAATHYNTIGITEHRVISFDPLAYLADYPDLKAAYGTNTLLATRHYVTFGHAEGRTITPIVLFFSPADNSIGAAVENNIVLTFSEPIQKGTGAIEIHIDSPSGSLVESFNVATSTHLNVSGTTLTIDPTVNLSYNTHYYVTFNSGTVKDLAGKIFTGTSTYDFTTAPDTTPPTVLAFSPADNSTGAAVESNIVLTFSEPIQKGTGTIEIHVDSPSGALIESFNIAASPHLSFSGSTLTIDPTLSLSTDTHYYVTFGSGTVMDLAGNNFAGTSTYDFKTAADTTPPMVLSFNPADGSTGVAVDSNILLTFSEPVQKGTGTIEIHSDSPTGALIESFNVATSTHLSFSGTTLTIDPTYNLSNNTQYYVTFSAGTVKDLSGNSYAGTAAYDFRTVVPTLAPHGFNISLSFSGNSSYLPYFQQAKAVWEKIIIGDLPDIAGIDDISITASVASIDGAGGILAQAGPTAYRSSADSLPYMGTMQFDSADMASMASNGTLTAVITHEMAHVLGFGSMWSLKGFNSTFGHYTGSYALTEYRSLSNNPSATYVPLETGGGGGTANVHWSEIVFNQELMTGFVNGSGSLPLSRLTVAAMQDLGYQVDYSAADYYSLLTALTAQAAVGVVGVIDNAQLSSSAPILSV